MTVGQGRQSRHICMECRWYFYSEIKYPQMFGHIPNCFGDISKSEIVLEISLNEMEISVIRIRITDTFKSQKYELLPSTVHRTKMADPNAVDSIFYFVI